MNFASIISFGFGSYLALNHQRLKIDNFI